MSILAQPLKKTSDTRCPLQPSPTGLQTRSWCAVGLRPDVAGCMLFYVREREVCLDLVGWANLLAYGLLITIGFKRVWWETSLAPSSWGAKAGPHTPGLPLRIIARGCGGPALVPHDEGAR